MRTLLILWHRYTGWILLFLLGLQAMTGVLLAYDHKLDELINPQQLEIASDDRLFTSVDNITKSAQSALPNIVSIASLRKPIHHNTTYIVYPKFSENSPYHGRKVELLIDPYNAEVVDVRVWGEYFVSFIYTLHSNLLSGEVGVILIGCLGILFLLNIIIGVFLSWPTNKKTMAFYFLPIKSQLSQSNMWRRKHTQVGLIIFPLLTLSILSGVAMAFHDATNAFLKVPKPLVSISKADKNTILSTDVLIRNAETAIPDSRWFRVSLPSPTSKQPVVVNLQEQSDPRRSVGSSTVWLDPSTGQVLDVISYSTLSASQQLSAWFFPIHNGEIIGHVGKFVIILIGISTLWLSVTGLRLLIARVFT